MSAVIEGSNKSEAGKTGIFKRGSVPAEPATSQDQVVSRVLDAQENEWKKRIYEALLEVMDLSLISTIAESEARKQIRSISARLLHEYSAPMSLSQRQQVIRCIEDEVMGLGPLEPLLADKTVSLSVLKTNKAQHLYSSLGFKVIGEDEHSYFMEFLKR